MSHIATVKVKLKDLPLLSEVCEGLSVPCDIRQQEVRLYSGSVQAAARFQLQDWRYPVAVQADGTVQYDNFNGQWGDSVRLHQVLKAYAERIVLKQALRMGAAASREERGDGTVVLRLFT